MPNLVGEFKWAVLLCKFANRPNPVHNIQFYKDLISGQGLGSLADYWNTMSYGKLDMSQPTFYGWETLPFNEDQSFYQFNRGAKIEACKAVIRASFVTQAYSLFGFPGFAHDNYISSENSKFAFHNGFMAIIGGNAADAGSAGNGNVLFDDNALRMTYMAHEAGHGLGLDHSFDTNPDPWDSGSDSRPGAYGNSHDIMSAETFGGQPAMFNGANSGSAGPSLNALTREQLGWLPPQRIATYSHRPGETWGFQIDIAALNAPEVPRSLLLKINAIDHPNLPNVEYAVEYRPRVGWDAGASADSVVIHMTVEGDKSRVVWSPSDNQDWYVGDLFVDIARQLSISVDAFPADKSRATLYVRGGPVTEQTISLRKTLKRKAKMNAGVRAVASAGFPRDSVRVRALAHPPQFK